MGNFTIGPDEQLIIDEVAELGRLTEEQEDILYNMVLRQDELGRQSTNMLLKKILGSPIYQPMLDREFITYEVFNAGGNPDHVIGSIYVSLKGVRYCIVYGDEISPRRKVDPAGSPRRF